MQMAEPKEQTITPAFIDMRIRADLAELCGDTTAARHLRDRSLEIGSEVEITCYAYQLMWRSKVDEAIALLEKNAEDHPMSWNVYDSLAEAHESKGDIELAIDNYLLAAELTSDEEQLVRIYQQIDRLRKIA
jgi:predicted Zn-dependent protease